MTAWTTNIRFAAVLALGLSALPFAANAQSTSEATTETGTETPTETTTEAEAPDDGTEMAPKVLDMAIGAEDAPVTVIEYASFTCPHCASFHTNVFSKLKAEYVDTGKVRFIHREVYFDQFGLWAGMVARCAGPDVYFGITDQIYSQQQQWAKGADATAIAENLRTLGLTAGLAPETLDACMSDGEKAQALVDEFEKNRVADEIKSTPSFIIGDRSYTNMSYEDFSKILDEALGE